MQIAISPYFGPVDLSQLQACPQDARLDLVSVADILRNSFVYPPHSILEGVKLASLGFDPTQFETARIHATASGSLPVFHSSTPWFIRSDASFFDDLISAKPSSLMRALSNIFCTSSSSTVLSWLFLMT